MNTMFCLVSRQSMANVLPVLMYKPENVVLFTTPEEKHSADNLESLFKSKRIRVNRLDGLDAYDFNGIKKTVEQEIIKYKDPVYLNVTGGTKLMALAAYEIFTEKNKPIVYCNTERNEIIHLYPKIFTEKLELNLSIYDYLKSYGYTVIYTRTDKINGKETRLFKKLDERNLLKKFSEFLNRYRSGEAFYTHSGTYSDKENHIFSIQKTASAYILYVYDEKFKFDENIFMRGDWLEDYTLYKLKKFGFSPEVGVKIVSSNNVENEIDLIFLNNYKLYLISCKSGRNNDPNKDIYEIETLRNVAGGTFGKAFLITTRPLTKRIIQRAKELHVKPLTHEQIDSIKDA